MKPPHIPQEEYEEIVFVRNLCADLIKSVDEYFSGRYPNGTPFLPDAEDRKVLQTIKGFVFKRISENRSKFPVWQDEDVEALTETVFLHMNMRFKRVERNMLKLPEYPMLVEALISAAEEKPAVPATDTVVRLKPNLRLVKSAPVSDGE